MNNHASITLAIVALSISALTFLFSILSFAWQHWWKVDSIVCTFVGGKAGLHQGGFQISLANLGTQTALLIGVRIEVTIDRKYKNILFYKIFSTKEIPQIIRAGEIASVFIETTLKPADIAFAGRAAEKFGDDSIEIFFTIKIDIANPNGETFIGEKRLRILSVNHKENTWTVQTLNRTSFSAVKVFKEPSWHGLSSNLSEDELKLYKEQK